MGQKVIEREFGFFSELQIILQRLQGSSEVVGQGLLPAFTPRQSVRRKKLENRFVAGFAGHEFVERGAPEGAVGTFFQRVFQHGVQPVIEPWLLPAQQARRGLRSEERRVGKEGRARWWEGGERTR